MSNENDAGDEVPLPQGGYGRGDLVRTISRR